MAVIEWTAPIPESQSEFEVVDNQRDYMAMSGASHTVEFTTGYWVTSVSFGTLDAIEEREVTSMLGAMRGRINAVKVPCWTRLRTDDIGTVTVQTAAANALAMTVSAPSAANQKIFSKGDYITIGETELVEIIADSVSDGSGVATLTLNKRLRSTWVSGTAIEYKEPYCLMKNRDDRYGIKDRRTVVSTGTLNLREAF